ncbi:insulinase (Peptidase family M16) family protein isoform X2 [Wolffia australiana]
MGDIPGGGKGEMAIGIGGVEITKPRTDKREYRRVVLPNSLEVLLISDTDTDKAAASMCVEVGSFSDPDGLEGLAHFLEHMLFYSSEKYPLEGSYMKFISEHGGSTNAYTDSEHTNFYFDVNSDYFQEALDRFSQFFIKPLISSDATLREIKAVDSENQKNLLSDPWRVRQLQKHLSSKEHPYHKFSTGNWNTLEVIPKARGVDTRQELIKFYHDTYSANLMHLVAYGKESLDDLQSLVERKFMDVQNSGRNGIRFPGQPCSSEHLELIVKAVPVKEGHKLQFLWPVTPNIQHYKEGPCRYLGHLIGHEGNGSLFFALKKLGWAISLSAGEGEHSYEFSFFSVVIELTDAGHEHFEDIVGLLFKYISLVRNSGLKESIFKEFSTICETKFHYQDKIAPMNYAAHVSSNMQFYPPEDWLVASSMPSKFFPTTIHMVLDSLVPENLRIFWESKKFEGCTDLTEPWYGTSYSVEKMSSNLIQHWVEQAPEVSFSLPAPNAFIPSDFTLKTGLNPARFPVMLKGSLYARLWYKPDTMFFTPKGYICVDLNCPRSNHSPEAEVLTDLFTRLLMDSLNEFAYDAQVAGLYYWVQRTTTGFQVIVFGYNHKLRVLLEAIIEKITQLEVKADRFSVIKEDIWKEYQNFKFQQPFQQALYYCSLLLSEKPWPLTDILEVLPKLDASALSKFVPELFSKTFLECYVTGNFEPKEAESIIEHAEEMLFRGRNPIGKPILPSEHLTNRITKLEKGSSFFYPVEVLNQSDENSSLVHYIQVHQDDAKMNVKLQLFALIAKQPAFHQLRSVEQLGYITVLRQRNKSGVWGLQVVIQSNVKDLLGNRWCLLGPLDLSPLRVPSLNPTLINL